MGELWVSAHSCWYSAGLSVKLLLWNMLFVYRYFLFEKLSLQILTQPGPSNQNMYVAESHLIRTVFDLKSENGFTDTRKTVGIKFVRNKTKHVLLIDIIELPAHTSSSQLFSQINSCTFPLLSQSNLDPSLDNCCSHATGTGTSLQDLLAGCFSAFDLYDPYRRCSCP